jgi:hypothetical protein
MKRTTLWFTKEQHKQLKAISTDRVKMAEHIRRAIDYYLDAPAVVRMGGLTTTAKRRKDLKA